MISLFSRGALALGAFLGSTVMFGRGRVAAESLPLSMRSQETYRSCDDFPSTIVDMAGRVSFAKPIHCTDPVTVHVEEDLFIVSTGNVDMLNVHFVVHKTGKLTISAEGAVGIKREEEFSQPLLFVIGGKVRVEAERWLPVDHANFATDEAGVVRVSHGGSLTSAANILYTDSSIVVVNSLNDHDYENGNAALKRSVPRWVKDPMSRWVKDPSWSPKARVTCQVPKPGPVLKPGTAVPVGSNPDRVLIVPQPKRWVFRRRSCSEPRRPELDVDYVLQKSGLAKKEWIYRFFGKRKKSKDDALHATEDGVEVTQENKKVWGISVDDIW